MGGTDTGDSEYATREERHLFVGLPWEVPIIGLYLAGVIALEVVSLPGDLRLLVLLPLLLFLPGYALTTVFLPYRSAITGRTIRIIDSPDHLERAGLSFGLSIATLPFLGGAVSITFGAIAGPLVELLVGFVAVVLAVGTVRRLLLSPNDRYLVPFGQWYRVARNGTTRSPLSAGLMNLFLVVSIIIAVGVLGAALAFPQDGAAFTEFGVGSVDGGQFDTSAFATDLTTEEATEYDLLLENHEREDTSYEIVVQAERIEEGQVTEVDELTRTSVEVGYGERWIEPVTVTPTFTGENIRLSFLLYVDGAPVQADRETADYSIAIWVDIE